MSTPHEALEILLAAADDGRLEKICDQFGIDMVSVFGSALDEGSPAPGTSTLRFGSVVLSRKTSSGWSVP